MHNLLVIKGSTNDFLIGFCQRENCWNWLSMKWSLNKLSVEIWLFLDWYNFHLQEVSMFFNLLITSWATCALHVSKTFSFFLIVSVFFLCFCLFSSFPFLSLYVSFSLSFSLSLSPPLPLPLLLIPIKIN